MFIYESRNVIKWKTFTLTSMDICHVCSLLQIIIFIIMFFLKTIFFSFLQTVVIKWIHFSLFRFKIHLISSHKSFILMRIIYFCHEESSHKKWQIVSVKNMWKIIINCIFHQICWIDAVISRRILHSMDLCVINW